MSSIKQLEALNGGGLYSGFVYFYEVREQFNHLVLGREDLLLAVHATHPLARKPAVRIKDLAAEPFIGIRRDVMPDYHDRVIAACRRKGLTPRIVQETHNELTVLQLVSVEMGIGFVRCRSPAGSPRMCGCGRCRASRWTSASAWSGRRTTRRRRFSISSLRYGHSPLELSAVFTTSCPRGPTDHIIRRGNRSRLQQSCWL